MITLIVAAIAIGLVGIQTLSGPWKEDPSVAREPVSEGARAEAPGLDDQETDRSGKTAETQGAPTARSPSIAVLPFANMSGDPDNEYFSDGLTDTLLHVLSKVPELQVAARTSSFKFKNKAEDISLIGEQLRVDHVLEGSVQRSGERVRITAQLIKADDGYHLWSGTFDRTLDDIFAVQDEIASNVVDALTDTLLGQVPKPEPMDAGLYDDFLRAQALVHGNDAAKANAAVDLLESIVDRDPTFARGYALLAEAYYEQVRLAKADWDAVQPLAEAAALRAVELAPDEADAWLALAGVRRRQQNLSEMLRLLERAVELEPNSARALSEYGSGLRRVNRFEESLPITRRAVLLDPLNPALKEGLGYAYFFANRYDEAEAMWKSALELSPGEPRILDPLGNQYTVLGQWADALQVYEQLRRSNSEGFLPLQRLFYLHLGAGDLESASAILDRMLEASEARALDDAALLCMQKGDRSCWLRLMRRYAEQRDTEPDTRARIAYVEGEIETATRLLEEDVEREEKMGEPRNASVMELAALLHRSGDDVRRDALLDQARERHKKALDQGVRWIYVTHYVPALWAAARGDAVEACRLASIANREGPPIATNLAQNFLIWDTIRDTPEFESLMAEVRSRQAEVLAEMQAVASWDPHEADDSPGMQP